MNSTPYNEDTEFNLRMQPFADAIYRRIWRLEGIKRNLGKLDKDRGIDVILMGKSGLTNALQEKFRRYKYRTYQQFTIEYKNNPLTNEPGEFYKLAANYYFYGYSKEDGMGFYQWWIVNLNKFKDAYEKGSIRPDEIMENKKHGHASFLCFNFDRLDNVLALQSSNRRLSFLGF